MGFRDELDKVTSYQAEPATPPGWTPGIEWSEETGQGTLTSPPLEDRPDRSLWERIIRDFGLDPDGFDIIDGSISLIGWQSPVKGQGPDDAPVNLTRYKVRLQRRGPDRGDWPDVDELVKVGTRRRKIPPQAPTQLDTETAMVVAMADWQIGKCERGDGTEETVARIDASFEKVLGRLNELVKLGRPVDTVWLVGLGDLVEQCAGHYSTQQSTTDLDRRSQMRVARSLIFGMVDQLAELGYRVALTGVPGNHGENRQNGKAITPAFSDNDDLAVIEQVGEALRCNPDRYANVHVSLPDDYSFTVDIAGVPCGFYHGHITKGGTDPSAKIRKWWEGQMMGQCATVRDARILVTGHYHHLSISEASGRTHMQTPAMDPGSHWWTTMTGQNSPAGMLTVLVSDRFPRGWDEMRVL